PAGGVGHEEEVSGHYDAIGTGFVVVRHLTYSAGTSLKDDPLEPPSDVSQEYIRPSVDDVDALIGTIAEIVKLGGCVDPADIKGSEGAQCRRDRDDREKLDRPSVVVLVSAARSGAEQQDWNDNDEKQNQRARALSPHCRTSFMGHHPRPYFDVGHRGPRRANTIRGIPRLRYVGTQRARGRRSGYVRRRRREGRACATMRAGART